MMHRRLAPLEKKVERLVKLDRRYELDATQNSTYDELEGAGRETLWPL